MFDGVVVGPSCCGVASWLTGLEEQQPPMRARFGANRGCVQRVTMHLALTRVPSALLPPEYSEGMDCTLVGPVARLFVNERVLGRPRGNVGQMCGPSLYISMGAGVGKSASTFNQDTISNPVFAAYLSEQIAMSQSANGFG